MQSRSLLPLLFLGICLPIYALPQVPPELLSSSSSTSTTVLPTALPTTTNGRCGPGAVTVCGGPASPFGECCSRWGWCGNSREYCGDGCQPIFGYCAAASGISGSVSVSGTASSSTTSCSDSSWSSVPSGTSSSFSSSSFTASVSSSVSSGTSSFGSASSSSSTISGTSSSISSSISGTPTPTYYYFRTRVLSGNQALDGLYLYAEAQGPNIYDPNFRLGKDPAQVGAIVDSTLRWLIPSGTTVSVALTLQYEDNIDWQPISLGGGAATTGVVLDSAHGLVLTGQLAWWGWLACYWNHAGKPQMFWLSKHPANTVILTSCAYVEIVPERAT